VYPYGNDYEATACFGRDIGEEELAPVGSYLGCQSSETGYEGVFDLSGNVWEWEDCCKTENESSLCRVRGGALNSEQDELRCDYDLAFNPFDTSPSIGFRCCFP
jgi:formylglycine-generating enzyme required for sulfatase activity